MKKLNLQGMTFNRWHVIEEGEKSKCGHVRWWCWCDCEKDLPFENRHLFLKSGSSLKNNKTLSCGCLSREIAYIANRKFNEYEEAKDYVIGKTASGKVFYIDKEDYELVHNYCWNVNSKGYLTTTNKEIEFTTMHRLIMKVKNPFIQVDHINHNKLDNRKCNLRLCSNSRNQENKGLNKNNKSGVSGVTWHKRDCIWVANISVNNKRIYLGRFNNFDDAVKARKDAEEKYFGEFSYDNSNKIGQANKQENNGMEV